MGAESEFEIELSDQNSSSAVRIYCLFEIMVISSLRVGRDEHFHKEEIE